MILSYDCRSKSFLISLVLRFGILLLTLTKKRPLKFKKDKNIYLHSIESQKKKQNKKRSTTKY